MQTIVSQQQKRVKHTVWCLFRHWHWHWFNNTRSIAYTGLFLRRNRGMIWIFHLDKGCLEEIARLQKATLFLCQQLLRLLVVFSYIFCQKSICIQIRSFSVVTIWVVDSCNKLSFVVLWHLKRSLVDIWVEFCHNLISFSF